MDTVVIPSFTDTMEALLKVVEEAPEYRGNRYYADEQGQPMDLVGWALHKLGLPLAEATAGRRKPLKPLTEGTPWAEVMFPLLWTRLFNHNANFFDMQFEISEAENYLVYAMLDHISRVSNAPAKAESPWVWTLQTGLKSFYGFLNHPNSGFLVQCSHKDAKWLRGQVDSQVKEVLQ